MKEKGSGQASLQRHTVAASAMGAKVVKKTRPEIVRSASRFMNRGASSKIRHFCTCFAWAVETTRFLKENARTRAFILHHQVQELNSMRGTAGLILAFIVLSGLAGCLQRPDATAGQSVPDGVALPRPTVVALLDSGINPYHEAFRASGVGAPLLENLGISATRVNLSMMGSWQDRSAADDEFWQSVQSGELYAFSGTRVLAVTMGNGTQYGRILDNAAHGTQVAGVLAREDPNAIIVMVQVDGGFCPLSGQPGCIDDASIARGMQWAASQPWIDVISVSIGLPGNVASPDAIESTARPSLEGS